MIISSFLGALFGEDRSVSAQAQARMGQEQQAQRVAVHEQRYNELAQAAEFREAVLRGQYREAESRALVLRDKLEAVRPYLVAAAKGSSLQAKGDLAALDAVLRSTKP